MVGSSSSRTRGSGTSAQASASFCFMPPLRLACQPVFEAVHIEHAQIAAAALQNLGGRHEAQIADVADVLHDAEIGIQTEGLREISGVRSRVTRRHAEHFGGTRGRFHDAREDLESGSFAGAVGTDQPEDFAIANFEIDAAHGFEIAIAFPEIADADRRLAARGYRGKGRERRWSAAVIC